MYDVIIVGAGIAGLGAARVLTREGYHVIVLEARNRPGGRIHSIQLPPLESPYPDTPDPDPSNHDNLSVFHASKSTSAQFIQDTNNPSESTDSTHTAAMDSSVSTSGTASPCTPTTLPGLEPGDTIDVDLGANYLIGCSNRQADQPLFHMARLLGVPTATSAGDLCKKYRGWECAELASWRNHLIPGAPSISIEEVAEGVFLFDKVIHLAVHNHLKLKSKLSKARKQFVFSNLEAVPVLNEPTVKQFIDGALDAILKSEARFGIRPQAAFRSATEEGIFNSVITRYLAYVNPLERLPHTVLDELCEVANPRWHLNMNDTQVAKMFSAPSGLDPSTRFSLADQLALAYPSTEQREAYQLWAERKLSALALDQAGACSAVVRSVHVSWEDRLVTGRFSDLIQPLMHNVPIVYNTTVTLVNWLSDADSRVGVRVHIRPSQSADMNPSTTMYEGKHCIITVPVGVLKGLDSRSAIAFQPPLPRSKQEAIERLAFSMKGAATHDKVILRFRSPEDLFWDTKAAHLKCPDPRLHILNLHRYGKPGVLCAHLWGGSGLTPYGMSDQEVVNIILDLLDRMHPEIRGSTDVRKRGIPDPVQYVVTRWSEDPYALGAYTTGEPGSSDADRLDYAMTLTDQDAYELTRMNSTSSNDVGGYVSTKSKTPTPRLLFAGEGTLSASEAKECTHGALQTGVRCALELLPFLSNSSATHVSADQHTIIHPHSVIPMNKLAHYLVGKSTSRGRSRYRVEPSDRRTRSVRRPTKHIMDEVLDFAPGRRGGGESYSVRRSHSASDTSMVMATSESSMSSSDYDECHTTDTDAGTSSLNGRHTGSELRVFTHRRPGRGGFVNVCRANDVTSTVRGVPEIKTRGSGCGRNKAKPSRTRRSDGKSKCLPTGHKKPSFTTVNNRCRPTRPLTHIRKIREAWPSLSARGRAQTLSRLSELLDELRSETGPHHVGSQNMHKSPFSLSPLANCTVQLRYTSRHSTKLE